jgi:hypothetical protein
MVVINIERQHAMQMALLHVRILSTHSSHSCLGNLYCRRSSFFPAIFGVVRSYCCMA